VLAGAEVLALADGEAEWLTVGDALGAAFLVLEPAVGWVAARCVFSGTIPRLLAVDVLGLSVGPTEAVNGADTVGEDFAVVLPVIATEWFDVTSTATIAATLNTAAVVAAATRRRPRRRCGHPRSVSSG
jgi:hypothetical protein